MTPLTLLGSETSPFVRTVRVLALERGVPVQLQLVDALGDDPALLAHSPVGRIPVLLTEHGALPDTRSACRHLHPGPRDAADLFVEGCAHGVMEAAVALRMMSLRPPAEQHAPTTERLTARVHRVVAALPTPTAWPAVGSIALACALSYLDFRRPVGDWRHGSAALAAWAEEAAARPSMQQTAFPLT